MNDDTISRQAAIDKLKREEKIFYSPAGLKYLIGAVRDLPSARPQQRWIPCSERLPEESGRYIISALDGIGRRTTVALYQSRYKAWTMTGRMAYWNVVAWMPLPEPYKGGIGV